MRGSRRFATRQQRESRSVLYSMKSGQSYWAIVGLIAFSAMGGTVCAEEQIDYNRDIRPLISNSCVACHGPDEKERKAKLRLDTFEGATADMGGYAAIIPGNVEESEFFYRITTDEADDLMPPEGKGRRFNKEEIDLIKRWIEQGGKYARHWSYEKPFKTELPKVKKQDWPRNPVDHFILSRLEKEGLEPSPEADRLTLARRVSLDLIGLPPTLDEAQHFANDKKEGAYERIVDALLAKPAFGERWGRVWLDLARYADSAGYADDPLRTIWAYRDYVIRSLNDNKPFDQFTIEQIAGDLLENPTDDQLVATAFHRNTLTNSEGGTDDEEFRNEAIVDRVNTTFAVWMGTTMACAQCHTHKYDPITQEEFFQVFDFFNQSEDADKKSEVPVHELWSEEQIQQKAQWQQQISQLKKEIETPTDALAREQKEWLTKLRKKPDWMKWKAISATAKKSELAIAESGVISSNASAEKDDYVIELEVPSDKEREISGLRLVVTPQQTDNFVLSEVTANWEPAGSAKNSQPGRFVRVELPGKGKFLHLAEVEVYSGGKNIARSGKATQISTGFGGPPHLAIDGNTDGDYQKKSVSHTGSGDNPWFEIDLQAEKSIEKIVIWNRMDGSTAGRIQGYQIKLLDEKRKTVWETKPADIPKPSATFAIDGTRGLRFDFASATYEQKGFPATSVIAAKRDPKQGWAIAGGTGKSQELTLFSGSPVKVRGGKLRISLSQQSVHGNHLLKHFELAITGDPTAKEWAGISNEIRALIEKPESKRSEKDKDRLAAHFRSIAPSLKKPRNELAKLEKQFASAKPATSVPIMRDLPADKQRKTHVQLRGNFKSLDKQVKAGVPTEFHLLRNDLPRNRLALANWLVDDENPLTPRVIANRHWEQIFGIGIVETSEEFGSQGELPWHPELLDWLAVELQENGWDLKKFLRLLVTSSTYRQSSRVSPELKEKDPFNRLLARGPRFRISAEMVRDQALAVSGLLSLRMYGPPVNPPQPNLGLKAAFGSGTDWVTSKGEDRYRRGIYTTWRRSSPYPSMATFDAPNREVCTVKRTRTNTPLQALVTLNDPVYIEAAQALGRKMEADGKQQKERSPEDQIRQTMREVLIREPGENEITRLAQLYRDSRKNYESNADQAKKMAEVPIGPAPEGSDVPSLAAWTVVNNVLLNLDELFLKR